jgi:hypothetical protein
MSLDLQSGLQLLGLLGIGGLAGAVIALVSAGARLKTDWATLRDALLPYLQQRKAAGDVEAEFLLEAVGPVDADMKQSAAALRDVQERMRKKK